MSDSLKMVFPVAVLNSAFNKTAKGSFRPLLQLIFKGYVGLRAKADENIDFFDICDDCGLNLSDIECWFEGFYLTSQDYIKYCKNSVSRVLHGEKMALTSISVRVFKDFYNNDSRKNETDKISLLAVLALKSIIGNRPAGYTTWEMVLSRMAGNLRKCSVEELPEPIRKYNSRKLKDKLRNAIIRKWKVQYYFKGRQPWYSLKRPPFDLKKWVDEIGTP